MMKNGLQKHDFYFKKYEKIKLRSPKTDIEKKHSKLFKKYKFKSIVTDIVRESNILEDLSIFHYKEDKENAIVELVLSLFYPHFKMAQDLLSVEVVEKPNKFIDGFVDEFLKALIDKFNSMEYDTSDNNNDSSIDDNFFFSNISDYNAFVDFSQLKEKNELSKKFFDRLKERIRRQDVADVLEFNEYGYFMFKKYFSKINDVEKHNIYIRKEYAGLWNYLVCVKCNKFPNSLLKSRIYSLDMTTEFTKKDLEKLKEWYCELFDSTNNYYINLPGEDKYLEQRLLDMLFGCNIIGYTMKKAPCDDIDGLIEEVSPLGILGFTPTVKEIIDIMIKENDEGDLDESAEDSDVVSDFVESILSIFDQFTSEFVRYVYTLGTYKERSDYIKSSRFEISYSICDEWKYVFSKECAEKFKNEITLEEVFSTYIEELPIDLIDNYYLFEEEGDYTELIRQAAELP